MVRRSRDCYYGWVEGSQDGVVDSGMGWWRVRFGRGSTQLQQPGQGQMMNIISGTSAGSVI